jgi:hypothetical protein
MVWERANFWLSVSLCYSYRLNAVMDWKMYVEKLELNDA